MKWRKTLMQVLRWSVMTVGSVSTAALGFNPAADHEAGLRALTDSDHDRVLLPNTLNATADDRYAAHRSHSSHRSHRSHRSSGSRGGIRTTPPAPTPQPQQSPQPSSPSPSTPPRVVPQLERQRPQPTPQDLSMMVVRVQAALMRLGHYKGDIDGILGPMTRSALNAFQKSKGLAQTGRMDIDTLTRLGISIP